jgi:hypothetical protein
MTTTSADESPWSSAAFDPPLTLAVVLLRRTYVLPWSQFLYAECGDSELRLIFAVHNITVKGANLNGLVDDIAKLCIARLREPTRPDRFLKGTGPFIREITVEKVDQE